MIKSGILVADSGGTGTEWCYVDPNGCKTYFSGRSYHPLYWSEEFIAEQKVLWSTRKEMLKAKLAFFGAGCLSENKAAEMKRILCSIGFSDVKVRSDLHAAAFSSLSHEDGCFAILGTGSVAAEKLGGHVQNIIGGLGYLLGDEGSGYYFGKLLIQKLLKGELPEDLSDTLHRMFGQRSAIIQNVYGIDGRAYLSGMAKLLADNAHPVIRDLHKENISMFFQEIQSKINSENGISFVGSYAWYNQDVLKEVAQKHGISVRKIIEKPIEQLAEYLLRTSE